MCCVLLFQYAILLTIVMMAVMKYVLHSIDLQSENPWESKAVYLLYSELALGKLYLTCDSVNVDVRC